MSVSVSVSVSVSEIRITSLSVPLSAPPTVRPWPADAAHRGAHVDASLPLLPLTGSAPMAATRRNRTVNRGLSRLLYNVIQTELDKTTG